MTMDLEHLLPLPIAAGKRKMKEKMEGENEVGKGVLNRGKRGEIGKKKRERWMGTRCGKEDVTQGEKR